MTEKAIQQTMEYYQKTSSYLEGALQGTCHFGYTKEGEPFHLATALRSMEMLLGQTIALGPGSMVLDAGCGYGRVATTLSEQFGYHVVGVDLIGERLEEAQRYTTLHGSAQNVDLVKANYGKLPIHDASFSAVYTTETLCHADPLEEALDEFHRVLKPGGRLVLFEYSVPERETLDPIRKKITDLMVEKTGMASIERFTNDGFPDFLQKAGFEDITMQDISKNVWPTWHFLFWKAVRELGTTILHDEVRGNTNLAASLFIWPYRHQLGYKVVTAQKPV